MALKVLTLDTIKDLDLGRVGVGFSRLLEQAVRDCLDRPGDERARKLILQSALKPKAEIVGQTVSCEGAAGVAQLRLKLPDYESQEVDFGVKQNGRLVFNEESPRDHRQATLFGAEDEDARSAE